MLFETGTIVEFNRREARTSHLEQSFECVQPVFWSTQQLKHLHILYRYNNMALGAGCVFSSTGNF